LDTATTKRRAGFLVETAMGKMALVVERLMAVREIPKSYEYKCDNCSTTHIQENASGQYANGTPPKWLSLKVSQHSRVPVDILLCDQCKDLLAELHIIPGGIQ
jgi:ribosomal protein L37AE/L43A